MRWHQIHLTRNKSSWTRFEEFFGVAVAQLAEPWIVDPVDMGSSPIGHPKAFFTARAVQWFDQSPVKR